MNYPGTAPMYCDSLLKLINQLEFVRLIGGFVELKIYPSLDNHQRVIFGELLAKVKSVHWEYQYPAVTLTEIQGTNPKLVLLGETPTSTKLIFSVADNNDMILLGTGYKAIVTPLSHNLHSLSKMAETAEKQLASNSIDVKPTRRRARPS